MKKIKNYLDIVDVEKFISLIIKEPFDYTEWQGDLWKDKSLDDIFDEAKKYSECDRNN
jgi:hypothetical protein